MSRVFPGVGPKSSCQTVTQNEEVSRPAAATAMSRPSPRKGSVGQMSFQLRLARLPLSKYSDC